MDNRGLLIGGCALDRKYIASYIGYRNRESGAAFESLIESTLEWYKNKGIAMVEKTPEQCAP